MIDADNAKDLIWPAIIGVVLLVLGIAHFSSPSRAEREEMDRAGHARAIAAYNDCLDERSRQLLAITDLDEMILAIDAMEGDGCGYHMLRYSGDGTMPDPR